MMNIIKLLHGAFLNISFEPQLIKSPIDRYKQGE